MKSTDLNTMIDKCEATAALIREIRWRMENIEESIERTKDNADLTDEQKAESIAELQAKMNMYAELSKHVAKF